MIPTNKTDSEMIKEMYRLLIGGEHQPGIAQRVETMEDTLNGYKGSFGMIQKVNMMWRAHTWVIGGVGTLSGAIIGYFIKMHQ